MDTASIRPADPPGPALWWLPLLAGALPLAATVLAYTISVRLALIPSCNPFLDGCVSISRAARFDLPNILFRGLVLPAAALQALCWLLCPAWLRAIGAPGGRLQGALPWLGVVAAVCLALYGTFLGTEGEGYRWMRRHGVVLYFGFTCIGMLVVADAMHRRPPGRDAVARWLPRVLLGLCAALPLLGLAHVLLPLALQRPALKDALENVTEWWAGVIFTLFFAALAWAWRASGFSARLELRRPPR